MFSVKVKCPHCHKSLMNEAVPIDEKPSIQLNIEYVNHRGTIWLSSVYGSYNHKITFEMPENAIGNFSCPHCNKKFSGSLTCPKNNAPMVQLDLEGGGHVHFCTRKGCKEHHVEFDDSSRLIQNAYNHYQYMESDE